MRLSFTQFPLLVFRHHHPKKPWAVAVDVLINSRKLTVEGVWVKSSLWKFSLLDWHQIQQWRPNCLVTSAHASLENTKANGVWAKKEKNDVPLFRVPVWEESKNAAMAPRRVGKTTNFWFDSLSGRIQQIEVRTRPWWSSRKLLISANTIKKVTKKGVFVSSLVAVSAVAESLEVNEG